MEQLFIKKPNINPVNTCAFTGHRHLPEYFSEKQLYTKIETLIKKGVSCFYNGMAMGFDLLAAEIVIKLKEKYPFIRLIACIPCYNQEKSFSKTDQELYANVLKNADEQVLLSEYYFRGCMQVRDKYMADRADVLIAFCEKETGGAAFTLKYFQKKYPDKEVVRIE